MAAELSVELLLSPSDSGNDATGPRALNAHRTQESAKEPSAGALGKGTYAGGGGPAHKALKPKTLLTLVSISSFGLQL